MISMAAILTACSSKRTPKGILEPQPMQEVLFDMLMAGEFLNGYVLLQDTGIHRLVKSSQVYNQVLTLHKITPELFDKSMDWYQQHPQMMKEVLDGIVENRKEKSDGPGLAPPVPVVDPGPGFIPPDPGNNKSVLPGGQQSATPLPAVQ